MDSLVTNEGLVETLKSPWTHTCGGTTGLTVALMGEVFRNSVTTCVWLNWWKLWILKLYECQHIICFHILTQPQSYPLLGTSTYDETEAIAFWLPQEKAEQTDGPSLEWQPTFCWQRL